LQIYTNRPTDRYDKGRLGGYSAYHSAIGTCCLGKSLTESTYFEPDRYDLQLPLIRRDPHLVATTATPSQSDRLALALKQQGLIFQALTQVLTPLGIRFEFSIEQLPPSVFTSDRDQTRFQSPDSYLQPLEYQLLVRCYAQKSLECQILAAPLAKILRSIELENFRAAIVHYCRFAGDVPTSNQVADWRLRVDLTPPLVKLRSWARWGDVQAITQLLNLALTAAEIQISAVLKNLTLQIFCTLKQPQAAKFPAKKIVLDTIAPLLIELTPQGIHGATIHGVQSQPASSGQIEEPPVWIHWLDLPALSDPKFSPTPITLAGHGDEAALTFVLERLLNPDLEQCFEIGGIDLSLLYRQQVLHVMSEAPICPIQSQVATTVVRVLTQLGPAGMRGIRVHGRISGQSISIWTYGIDFDNQLLELPSVASVPQVEREPPVAKIGVGQRISEYLVTTKIWQPQLPIEQNDRLVYQSRFRWQPSMLLLLVGLGLATLSDLAMRLSLEAHNIAASSIPVTSQLSFNNPLLEQKLAQYQLRCLQHGVPDILIVGSSRALRGIDPAELQRGLIARGYANPQIYNFGINGATAQVVDLILRQLLTPQQLPKLVIWADGARAFNNGRSDRTYETIVSSNRYRQLAMMSGKRNNNSSLLQVQSTVQNTYQAIDTAIDRRLGQISLAYQHRDRLKTWLQHRVPAIALIDDNDRLATTGDPIGINERDIDFNGFLALDLQFDPDTYFQKYPRVTGASDGDYVSFQLGGNQDLALHQAIELLAAHHIPLVFVNMPLSDIYLDRFRDRHEVAFKLYMQKLMNSHQLTFIDLDGLLNKQHARFSDPSHLNQLGANDVSKYLVEFKEISW
jgi:hypothetical protein